MDASQVPAVPPSISEFRDVREEDGMLRAVHIREGTELSAPTEARLEDAACAARIVATLRKASR